MFIYDSSDQLTVIHPSATASADVSESTEVSATYDADVISAATIDVRTAASPRGFEETRHGLALGVDHGLSRTARANAGIHVSHTPDYSSGSFGLGSSVQDAGRNRTLGISLSAAVDAVGRAGDEQPVGHVVSSGGSLSLASVLSEWSVVDVASTVEYKRGFLENPYRFVPIHPVGRANDAWIWVEESVPEDRLRGAGNVRYRTAFSSHLFARAMAGVHLDSWGILGGSGELQGSAQLGEALCTLGGRTWVQRAASFYRGRYRREVSVPQWRTGDRKLSESFQVAGIARLEYELGQWNGMGWRVRINGELSWRRHIDTPKLPRETTLLVGSALEAWR